MSVSSSSKEHHAVLLDAREASASLAVTFLCIVGVAAMMIAFSGGISVGSSNHVGLVPVVRRILDPQYLPGDFGILVRLYHHRVFAYLVAALAALLGEDGALIALNIAGRGLLSFALWYLFCRVMKQTLGAFLAAGIFVALQVGWVGRGLELNDFLGDSQIMPPTFAHALVLLGVGTLIQNRDRMTAFLAGLVVLTHVQIGIIFVVLLLPFYAAKIKSYRAADIARLALVFLAPASLSLLYLWRMIGQGLADESFSQDYIDFRHPHHFELISTEAGVWVALHLLLQIAAYAYLRRQTDSALLRRAVGVLLALSMMLTILAIFHFLDYYMLHIGIVIKLQFIRLSPLITVFGLLAFLVAGKVWTDGRSAARRRQQFVNAWGALLIAIIAAWVFFEGETISRKFYLGVHRHTEDQTAWVNICQWIANAGPVGGTYLTPPGNAGFTYLSHRSNVVEFKINPDGGLHLPEWYARLRDLSGGELPAGRGLAIRKPLNAAYAALTAQQLIEAGKKYRAEYAVLPQSSTAQFEMLYENKDFRLVKLPQ